jgi:GrpB-like predicted nucleotidyltransferase (UPF0157 family)
MNEEGSLLSAINEDVTLRPYNSLWPATFTTERKRLESLLTDSFIDIQHFGSTAVPGLTARPGIDILAGVVSMSVADATDRTTQSGGYTTSAEFNATLSNRRWLMRWAGGHRTRHLHIVVAAALAIARCAASR